MKRLLLLPFILIAACTEPLPDGFRFVQQEESFESTQQINTKIDLLWVVDNSASMDVSQKKLRQGFETFAEKYMKPTWDIRLAVITTDLYLAHSSFQPYLNRTISGSVKWVSPYLHSRIDTFVNPDWNLNLVDSNGGFPNGLIYSDLVPSWKGEYSRLLPGIHDGPITAFCMEAMPYFFKGITNCPIRDDQNLSQGPDGCIQPSGGQTSESQCVNTLQNDTVRSGKAILNTMPPDGIMGDSTWIEGLVRDFMVNVSKGSSGHGSERGLGSLIQFLDDNETSSTAFFRSDSVRAIIFVSDEDDQTLIIPQTPAADFSPQKGYACDQAGLIAANGSSRITGTNGYCCTGSGCLYGDTGLSCPSKTVDMHTYTLGACADPTQLVSVSEVKDRLDSFFWNLDGISSTENPNYFITSIIPKTGATIQALQSERDQSDASVGGIKVVAVDNGQRYQDLANLVGNGSLILDIGENVYTQILDAIGKSIIEKRGSFTLKRAPTGSEDMIVKVIHENLSETIVTASQYEINGKTLSIMDVDFLLTLGSKDTIVINYQPKTAY